MTINLKVPDIRELKPRITVFGVGGAGGNAVNNMITAGLSGVDFVVANTDAQALTMSKAERIVQMGVQVTEGLGAGSQPDVGRAAAEEVIDEIRDHLSGAHMVFVTAGMGGGTGTGASPVISRVAQELGILTVGVVTKPFQFEGQRRMRFAEQGIEELHQVVDTLLIIPNQNLFRVANEKTTFADAFAMADQVLYSGVACITDLMVKEGLINLDFADVRAVMKEMGKAMMGTGEASGEKRALTAAEAAISNPLIDDSSMKGARGLLVSITGGKDLTLYEVDEAATRIREEVDQDANIIVGATFDETLEGLIRVSVVATGIDKARIQASSTDNRIQELTKQLRADTQRLADRVERTNGPAARAPQAAAPAASGDDAVLQRHDRIRGQGCGGGSRDGAGRGRRRDDSADPAEAVALSRADPRGRASRPDAGPARLHPAAAGARRHAHPADAAHRGIADARAKSAARQARRGFRLRTPGKAPHDPYAAPCRRGARSQGRECRATGRSAPLVRQQPSLGPMPARPAPRAHDSRAQDPVSEYAKKGAPQGLDPLGRQAPVHNSPEDDQLDIPAFLRRQVN